MSETADRDPVLMAVADGLMDEQMLSVVPDTRGQHHVVDYLPLRDAIYAALLSERHRAEEAKWLPMDSAPKDGTRVLVAWKAFAGISEHVELGKWKQRDGWCNTYGKSFHGIPDYFMPLPALPLTPEPTHER